jgi:tetratricopeptide (TPR) repeat protein
MKTINHRYQIAEKLGEGGTGCVYRVEDLMYGKATRALKTIRIGKSGLTDVSALRNEFSVLRQFDHPNIVKVYDFGGILTAENDEENGNFFFTLDLVQGNNLFDATATADERIISSLIFQIADALDYIHRHGLIHFDIKPENIIVSNSYIGSERINIPKIIDFGFAASSGEMLSGNIKGSLHFMAPELIAGKAYDQRIDLYSLGVTAFQILTRSLPFDVNNTVELLKRHEADRPPLVSQLRPGTSPNLVSLVSRLLEKDPKKRVQSACEITESLRPVVGTMKGLENYTAGFPIKKFVGRRKELEQLTELIYRAKNAGRASTPEADRKVSCLVGEKGIGKTPLLEEWKRQAQSEDFLIIGSRCYLRSSFPLEPFRWVLHELKFALLARSSAELLQKYDDLFSALRPVTSGEGSNAPPLDFQSEEERKKFLVSVTDLVIEASGVVPFILYIDDADAADETTLEMIRMLVRATSSSRPEVLISCNDLSTIEKDLRLLPNEVNRIVLSGLDDESIATLIEYHLRIPKVSIEIASALSRIVGNSPYVVSEFLDQFAMFSPENALRELTKTLNDEEKGVKFPRTINEVYAHRLRSCSVEEQLFLKVLSCFRTPVEIKFLERIQSVPSAVFSHLLGIFALKGVITIEENGNKVYISHSSFRRFVHEGLPREEYCRYHQTIAEELEASAGLFVGINDEITAYHFKEAGVNSKAFAYYTRASERATSAFLMRESVELLETALSVASHESEREETLRQLARQYDLVEDYEKAEETYEALVRRRGISASEKYHLLKSLGSVQTRRGLLDKATESFTRALEQAVSKRELMEIEDELTDIDISRGRLTEARNRCMQVLESLEELKDNTLVSSVYTKLGIISFYETKYTEGTEYFQKAFTMLEQSEDKAKLIVPLLNLGNAYGMHRQYTKAVESWTRALRYAEEIGNVHQQGHIHNNIGIAEYKQGHFQNAQDHYEQGLDIFKRSDNLPGEALCLSNLGEVYFIQSEYEKAKEAWERCLTIYTSIGDAQGLVESHCHLSQLLVSFEDIVGARNYLAEAGKIIEHGSLEDKRPIYYLSKTLLALTEKNTAEAEQYSSRAKDYFRGSEDDIEYCRLLLAAGRLQRAIHHQADATNQFMEAQRRSAGLQLRTLEAEACMELGIQSREDGTTAGAKPMNYLKEAYAMIENESVMEITWKICFELGTEYSTRGMKSKAKEFFLMAKRSLEYLGSLFTASILREKFWGSNDRRKALQSIKEKLNGLTGTGE